jgi:KaiC/GvpD/RAD55 family RecA-like ATPase
MTTKDQFLAQIDELVVKHTFGLEALEGIKKLKDTMAQVTADRDTYKGLTEELDKANREKTALVAKRDSEIQVLKQALADMQKAADDGRKAVYDAEKHKAVADTWQAAMAMVFKPNAVREAVQRNHTVVIPSNGGSAYTQAVQNQDFITREDA